MAAAGWAGATRLRTEVAERRPAWKAPSFQRPLGSGGHVFGSTNPRSAVGVSVDGGACSDPRPLRLLPPIPCARATGEQRLRPSSHARDSGRAGAASTVAAL